MAGYTTPNNIMPGSTQDMNLRLAYQKQQQQTEANRYGTATGASFVPNVETSGFPSSGGGMGYVGGGAGGGGSAYPGTAPGSQVVSSTGGGGGNINLSRDAYEAQQAMLLKSKLATDAFGKVTGQFGSNGAPGAQVQYGGANADAARAAAFARAKEQAGANAQASLRSMQDLMSSRGLHGSSIEAGAMGDVVAGGSSDISKFITNQLNEDLSNQQHVNDMTYQGGITQRGQDMHAKQSYMSMLASMMSGLY